MQHGSDCTKASLSQTERAKLRLHCGRAGLSLRAPGGPDPAWGPSH